MEVTPLDGARKVMALATCHRPGTTSWVDHVVPAAPGVVHVGVAQVADQAT